LNEDRTQVLVWAQSQVMAKLEWVTINSTHVAVNASKGRVDSEQALRDAAG
jgi:hypothetical protein